MPIPESDTEVVFDRNPFFSSEIWRVGTLSFACGRFTDSAEEVFLKMMIRFMVVTTLDLVKGTQFHGYIIV